MSEVKVKRLYSVDVYRGLLIFCMIVYHFLFDLSYFYGLHINWFNSGIVEFLADGVRISFLLLVGVSSRIIFLNSASLKNYFRSQFKRLVPIFISAIVITLITFLYTDEPVYFGILHLIVYAILFLVSIYSVYGAFLFILSNILIFLLWDFSLILYGIQSPSFGMLDFFPVFPWIIAPIFGFIIFDFIKSTLEKINDYFAGFNVLKFMGRHSLAIYMIHQPIILAMLFLVENMLSR